jgi:hypothetical protein
MENITNLSSNTPASIRAQIDAEYYKHSALGLRQAELIVYDRTKALSEYRYHAKKNDIELTCLMQRYSKLCSVAAHPFQQWWYDWRHDTAVEIEIDRVAIEIDRLSGEREYAQPLIRDAVSELAVALDRRESILRAHPELNVSPERFQEVFAQEIYNAKLPSAPSQPIFTPAANYDARFQQDYLCSEQLPGGR